MWLGSCEDSFAGFQTATCSPCAHGSLSSVNAQMTLPLLTRALTPPWQLILMTSPNPNHLLKATPPKTITRRGLSSPWQEQTFQNTVAETNKWFTTFMDSVHWEFGQDAQGCLAPFYSVWNSTGKAS